MHTLSVVRILFFLCIANFTVFAYSVRGENREDFPDVPKTHWASEAVNNLKNQGVLQGYLDGLFRGNRVITRYEMADVINGAWVNLNVLHDRIQSEQQTVSKKLDSVESISADIQALREQVMAVRKVMDAMKPWRQEIANIKQKSEGFRDEIRGRREEIEAMQEDIAAIQERLYRR